MAAFYGVKCKCPEDTKESKKIPVTKRACEVIECGIPREIIITRESCIAPPSASLEPAMEDYNPLCSECFNDVRKRRDEVPLAALLVVYERTPTTAPTRALCLRCFEKEKRRVAAEGKLPLSALLIGSPVWLRCDIYCDVCQHMPKFTNEHVKQAKWLAVAHREKDGILTQMKTLLCADCYWTHRAKLENHDCIYYNVLAS